MTEREIIDGCRKGDAAAQRELYERYAAAMMGVCCRYVRDRAAAEDLLHDGFLSIYANIGKFRSEGSFEGWCRRIFVNTALGSLRRSCMVYEPEENFARLDSGETDAVERMSGEELLEVIHRLPDGYRTILNLYAVEGYSHREISEMLGISEVTSRSQYSRARARLMEMLKEL